MIVGIVTGMGDQLCSLDACAGTEKYRPTIPLPPSRIDPIGCEVVAASETCLTAVGHVQPGRGESCSTDSTCRGDLTCRCGNDVCVEDVSFDVHVIGDDVVNVYSCDGNMFGEVTTHHTEQTFSYSGVCQDLVIVVNNTFVEQGLAVAIDYNGATYASGVNLQMRVARAPPLLDGYTQCCSYEYPDSTFLEPTVLPIHTNAADYPAYANFETTHGGALPMSYPLTIQQHVDYVYKVSVPFCT